MNGYPDRSFKDVDILSLDPGDVVIWDSRLWHGALKNKNGKDRWSLVATFRPWWMKQNFDPVRGFSEEIYSNMTDEQKALMGFLSLPPVDHLEKEALKEGYKSLKRTLKKYRERRVKDGEI